MMGQFLMSTRIYTGEASLEEIEHLGLKRAYIICDPFMEKCGRAGELAAMLNGLEQKQGFSQRSYRIHPSRWLQRPFRG